MFSYKNLFVTTILGLVFSGSVFAKDTKEFTFDFLTGNQGWQGDFTDYPVGEEAFFQLAWGWTNLPVPLPRLNHDLTKGMYLSGDNRSDDLFMFIRRELTGFEPEKEYKVIVYVTIENNIPPGEFGIGGSPGESVYFKVGASKKEPHKVDIDGFYFLNVDKGNQGQGGKNAVVVGNLANPLVDPLNPQYEPKYMSNQTEPLKVKSDKDGNIWVFLGTDSGFEGPSLYYIAHVFITVEGERDHHHHHDCHD